jgi:hypothetical protein
MSLWKPPKVDQVLDEVRYRLPLKRKNWREPVAQKKQIGENYGRYDFDQFFSSQLRHIVVS